MGKPVMLPVTKLTRKDLQSDQEVRWCPGCGDYSILAQVQKVLARRGVDRDSTVFVSGIGCSSRFPYYMNTYGVHGIHGRAPAIATGLKLARPDLDVWVITGDGDALSIGGNHFIHAMRRNIDLKVLLFNNRIYGLTKGQYSPTSELGKRSPSTPLGSPDNPFNPLSLALGAHATFVARAVDSDTRHLQATIDRAAAHHGTAFIELYQNCVVFNDHAFADVAAKSVRDDSLLVLEDGKPLLFGKGRDKGIRLESDGTAKVVQVGEGPGQVPVGDILVHDERHPTASYAQVLAHLLPPEFPTPVGVLKAVVAPTYDAAVRAQEALAREQIDKPDLEALWTRQGVWEVTG